MGRRRPAWTAIVGSSTEYLRGRLFNINPTSTLDACDRARRLLLSMRETRVDGNVYDYWSVQTVWGVHSLPRVVARGDVNGPTFIDERSTPRGKARKATGATQGPRQPGIDESWRAAGKAFTARREAGDGARPAT